MPEVKNTNYEQAASMVRVQGIMSIIFGGLGVLFGLVFLLFMIIAMAGAYTDSDAFGLLALFLVTVVFWLLPHVYLVIAGILLARTPAPRVVKTLTIINIVIGALWNYILLVFAIISIVQSSDYEKGYAHKK